MVGLCEKQVSYQKCQIQFHTIFCPCSLEIINSTIALRQKKTVLYPRFLSNVFFVFNFDRFCHTEVESWSSFTIQYSYMIQIGSKEFKMYTFWAHILKQAGYRNSGLYLILMQAEYSLLSFFVQFLLHIFDKHAYLLRFWSDSHNRLWNFNVLKIHLPISLSKQIVISNIEQFYFFTYPYVTKYFFVFIVTPNISINGVQCI